MKKLLLILCLSAFFVGKTQTILPAGTGGQVNWWSVQNFLKIGTLQVATTADTLVMIRRDDSAVATMGISAFRAYLNSGYILYTDTSSLILTQARAVNSYYPNTGGNFKAGGYIGMPTLSTSPAAVSGYTIFFRDSAGGWAERLPNGNINVFRSINSHTANRSYYLPDSNGTVALKDFSEQYSDTAALVAPYARLTAVILNGTAPETKGFNVVNRGTVGNLGLPFQVSSPAPKLVENSLYSDSTIALALRIAFNGDIVRWTFPNISTNHTFIYPDSSGHLALTEYSLQKSDTASIVSGYVRSVNGVANRTTATSGQNPVIDISASYVGQTSITTLGTVGTGVWNATAITYAKLNLSSSIVNADISTSAAIAYSKLNLSNSIVNGDISNVAWTKITGTPTTIGGYGITDYNSLGDARWLKLTGGNLTGDVFSTANLIVGSVTDTLNNINIYSRHSIFSGDTSFARVGKFSGSIISGANSIIGDTTAQHRLTIQGNSGINNAGALLTIVGGTRTIVAIGNHASIFGGTWDSLATIYTVGKPLYINANRTLFNTATDNGTDAIQVQGTASISSNLFVKGGAVNISRATTANGGYTIYQTAGVNDWITGMNTTASIISDYQIYGYGVGATAFSIAKSTNQATFYYPLTVALNNGSAGDIVVNGGGGLLTTRTAPQLVTDLGVLTTSLAATTYVPYTGATGNVTLGTHGFTANDITTTGTGTIFTNTGATTSQKSIVLGNTGGSLYFTLEGSAGGFFTGAAAYSTDIATNTATNLNIGTSGIVRTTWDASGNIVTTGGLTVNGVVGLNVVSANTSTIANFQNTNTGSGYGVVIEAGFTSHYALLVQNAALTTNLFVLDGGTGGATFNYGVNAASFSTGGTGSQFLMANGTTNDTNFIATHGWRQKGIDSINALLAGLGTNYWARNSGAVSLSTGTDYVSITRGDASTSLEARGTLWLATFNTSAISLQPLTSANRMTVSMLEQQGFHIQTSLGSVNIDTLKIQWSQGSKSGILVAPTLTVGGTWNLQDTSGIVQLSWGAGVGNGRVPFGSGAFPRTVLRDTTVFTYAAGLLSVPNVTISALSAGVVYSTSTGVLTNTAPAGVSVVRGSFSATGTATTTFTVTIGQTMANTNYIPVIAATDLLTAVNYYITNKTTTTFDVVFVSGLTGSVTFGWIVAP